MRDLIEWFVPPEVRGDPQRRIRHRGIAMSLLTISLVVLLMFISITAVHGGLSATEYAMFAASILTPLAGALLIRTTGDTTTWLAVTNIGGILIIAVWAYLTGGITSIALPGFLANIALLATFGNIALVLAMGVLLSVALIYLYVATVHGWLPASIVPLGEMPEMMLAAMLGSVTMVVLAGAVVARERAAVKATLRAAKAAAEQSSRAKSAFLGSMSQEFRNPLETILEAAARLRTDRVQPLTPVQQIELAQIEDSSRQLDELLTQVLEVSRIEGSGLKVQMQPLAVSAMLGSCVGLAVHDAEKAGVHLACDASVRTAGEVWADPVMVRQVLLNLISNGIKFNRRGGQVKISCRDAGGAFLRIIVSDDGRGIPHGREGELFLPFTRLVDEQSGIPGVGLGLTVAKHLTEGMHGRIGFDPAEGNGSCFWIDLPVARQDDPHGPARSWSHAAAYSR